MTEYSLKEILVLHTRNKSANWPELNDVRWKNGLQFPQLFPSFQLSTEDKNVFTIGSCFAREVGSELRELDFFVPTIDTDALRLNEFNPGTIAQRIHWTLDSITPPVETICKLGSVHVDLLVSHQFAPTTLAGCLEFRECLKSFYDNLHTANFVVITLGLSEAWFDLENNCYINRAPIFARSQLDRFVLRKLSIADTIDLLRPALERLTGSGKKVMLTVSPVPTQTTFILNQDAILANEFSKATLRCAAEELATMHNVDYFPSFEIVRSGGITSYLHDGIHIKQEVTKQVVEYMVQNYFKK